MPFLQVTHKADTIIFKTQAMRTVQLLQLLKTGFVGTDVQCSLAVKPSMPRMSAYKTLQGLVIAGVIIEDTDYFPRKYRIIPNKGVVVSYEEPDTFLKPVTVFTIALKKEKKKQSNGN